MRQEDYEWLTERSAYLFGKVTIKREDWLKLYEIYNQTFNQNKKPNACGACQRTVLDNLKKAYEMYGSRSMDNGEL